MCNGTPFAAEKISPWAGLEPGTAGSVGQRLTHWATGTPFYDATVSEGADWMANSVGSDQTASSEAVWSEPALIARYSGLQYMLRLMSK